MLKRKFFKVFSIVTILVVIFSFILSVPGSAISEMITYIRYDYSDPDNNYMLPFLKSKLSVDGNNVLFPNVNTYSGSDAFNPEYNSNWYDRYNFVGAEASEPVLASIGSDYISLDKRIVYSQSFGRLNYSNQYGSHDYLSCIDSFHIYYSSDSPISSLDSSSLAFSDVNGFTQFSIYGGSVCIPARFGVSEHFYTLWFGTNSSVTRYSCLVDISYDVYQFQTRYSADDGKYITELRLMGSVDRSAAIQDGSSIDIFNTNDIYDDVPFVDFEKDIYIDNVVIDVDASVIGNLPVNAGPSGYWMSFQLRTPVTLSGYSIEDVFEGGYEVFLNNIIASSDRNDITVDFENVSVVDWLVNVINSIMRLELIPDVSVGAILWFCVGLGMFFFLLKAFLGG